MITARTEDVSMKILYAVLFGSLILLFVGIIFMAWAYRPILTLRNAVQVLATDNADLTQRITITNNDDIGKISRGVNLFVERIQTILRDCKGSIDSNSQQIEKMQDTYSDNSRSLQHHLLDIASVATAVSQMSMASEEIARSSSGTVLLTQQAIAEIEASFTIVDEAVNRVSKLETEFGEMAISVSQMIEDVRNIDSTLSIIEAIAEQTNLLALNAAIEAARAGGHGRGFAVVADEVRLLASRTQQSTLEITAMLQKLRQGSDTVVCSLSATQESCSETSGITESINQALQAMDGVINKITGQANQIAAATQEQQHVCQEVSVNMDKMNTIAKQLDIESELANQRMMKLVESNTKIEAAIDRFVLR